jgi:glycosyltransferase involved in cell wall biosynthesis
LKLRLLAVIEASSITGPAKNLLDFARHGRDLDIETVFATFVRGVTSNLFIETARSQGVQVETIPERSAWDPEVLKRLRDTVARVQPDIVQSHAVKSHFLMRRSGVHHNLPWVAFHHGYTWPDLKARLYNQLDRWSLRIPRQVLTVSRPFREELMAIGVPGERIEVVHNAIPLTWGQEACRPDAARQLRTQLGIPTRDKVILIVGRLSREKDHQTLLRALHTLPEGLPAHLVIVGEGPERANIEATITNLGLGGRVSLVGHQRSAEPYYGIADLAVLSSLSEGSPNALLEAMVTGVPVVATNVGGIPEIVTNGQSALLVEPEEVEAMASAIASVLGSPGLAERLKNESHRLIETRHTPAARAGRLASVYRAIQTETGSLRHKSY